MGRWAPPGQAEMKFAEPGERQRLSFLLEEAVSREAMMWKVYVPKKPPQDTDISPAQRDEAVRWLTELHRNLQLYPETLALAVSILDRFLAPIKARPKYLRCIAIGCFFLAAKTCEEDECVPSLKELAGSSGCNCSPSEIRRMERVILDKLDWNLHAATPLHFLHIFHAMVLSCRPRFSLGLNRSQHLSLLTHRLFHCLADHAFTQVRGSMLALALITLELEACRPDWLPLTIDLLRKAQMDSSELIRVREVLARGLSTQRLPLPHNTVYIYQPRPDPEPRLQGTTPSFAQPSREPALCAATPARLQTLAGGEGSQRPWPSPTTSPAPVLLSPPRLYPDLHRLRKVTLRSKASGKRKVEQMEVDDFYDGIKRLYNEDVGGAVQEVASPSGAAAAPGGGGGGGGVEAAGGPGCSVLLSRQEGRTSPCPPLQPIAAP